MMTQPTTTPLFAPTTAFGQTLQNRIVMAPMTRCRAIGNLANALMATYYGQRNSAGLLITEGTAPSPNGLGYARQPGLFTAEQAAGWKLVTDAAHAGGAKIAVQLMHTGRVGHPANLPAGAKVFGPSALAAPGQMWTDTQGMQDHPVPEAMTEADIEAALDEFAASAKLAVQAGFDAIELHGANGYLIEQFLNTASNQRTDSWGGTVENRSRFALEAARRSAAAIGANKVGIRLSPYGRNGGLAPDPETDALYFYLMAELSKLGIGFVHVVDHSAMGAPPLPEGLRANLRKAFAGTFILSGGYDRDRAEADLAAGLGDLVAFGRPFLANPDLVAKFQAGTELAAPDFSKAYTPGPEGYTDWPIG